MSDFIEGFSKLTRENKIKILATKLGLSVDTDRLLNLLRSHDIALQNVLDELSENTLTNFPLPYGIAPNFLVNGKVYHVPMVTEESSVVAAASKAAKIWSARGGFHATVHSTTKTGHVHFIWSGNSMKLNHAFPKLKQVLMERLQPLTSNMEKRGGGVKGIELIDKTHDITGYFQLAMSFDTADAMGANFINSCLEAMADELNMFMNEYPDFTEEERKIDVIMAILSNYNPECVVKVHVVCPIEELALENDLTPVEYARKFKLAVDMSGKDVNRAVTHNKGIFNGIDAVSVATGNDYRAIEAGAHAFASRDGVYRGLSSVALTEERFIFSLELPLAVGTVGGVTAVHPLTKLSLNMLGKPSAPELMMIMASVGLASNFAAIHALITSGIQKGHMKMHLSNILNQLNASETQKESVRHHFASKVVTFNDVEKYLNLTGNKGKQHVED